MTLTQIVCGALAATALVASTPQADAAQIFATTYDISNGGGVSLGGAYNYWDVDYSGTGSTRTDGAALRIGQGDLTDGVIATEVWANVENYAGTGPNVGWYWGSTLNPVLTFRFSELTTISAISLFVDNTGYGGVLAPSRIFIDGIEAAFTAPALGTVGGINITGLNLTGGSHAIQLNQHDGSWIFLSEVQFIGISAVPEAPTWAMLIVGFGLAGSALRYRRRRTVISYN